MSTPDADTTTITADDLRARIKGRVIEPHDATTRPGWAAVKATYDPTNPFRRNQNVPPAGSPRG